MASSIPAATVIVSTLIVSLKPVAQTEALDGLRLAMTRVSPPLSHMQPICPLRPAAVGCQFVQSELPL